jgi:hypothetical protein
VRVPRPAGQGLEATASLRAELSFSVELALNADPLAEPVAVLDVPILDPRVALALHEPFQVGKALLPVVSDWVPTPPRGRLQSGAKLWVEGPPAVHLALIVNPLAEPVAILTVINGNPRVSLPHNEPFQKGKAFLPSS